MPLNLKPIQQQVILITGAAGVIGETLVKAATSRGARVFMVDEDEVKLGQILMDSLSKKCECAYNVAQCTEADQLRIALDHCVQTFGTVDTWINAVDFHFFSLLNQFDEEKARMMFDSNVWSAVNGSKVAAEFLSKSGGSVINLGVVLQKSANPLSGLYLASKKAVAVFTESLQKELKSLGSPVEASCIQSTLAEVDTVENILQIAEKGSSVNFIPKFKNRYAELKLRWLNKKESTQLINS